MSRVADALQAAFGDDAGRTPYSIPRMTDTPAAERGPAGIMPFGRDESSAAAAGGAKAFTGALGAPSVLSDDLWDGQLAETIEQLRAAMARAQSTSE